MDAVQHFVKTACQHEILSREDELQLARRAKAGDRAAFDRLVELNQRLVYTLARKHYGGRMPLADAIQEGNFGLMHAIRKFEPERGFKLSTYATWWIRQAIERARGNDTIIRIPTHLVQLGELLARYEARFPNDDDEQLAARMRSKHRAAKRTTAATVRRLRELRQPTLSLDQPSGDEESGGTLADLVGDQHAAFEEFDNDDATATLWAEVADLLPRLNEKQRYVVRRRYGLDGEPATLETIAGELGVTRERIRQIEKEALRLLRIRLGVRLEDAFLMRSDENAA